MSEFSPKAAFLSKSLTLKALTPKTTTPKTTLTKTTLTKAILKCLSLVGLWAALVAPAQALSQKDLQDVVVQCAVCHGADGVSRDDSIPNLDGQHDRYLYNQIAAFRAGRRPHKEMKFMSRQLTPDEMWAIAEYYSALPPR